MIAEPVMASVEVVLDALHCGRGRVVLATVVPGEDVVAPVVGKGVAFDFEISLRDVENHRTHA